MLATKRQTHDRTEENEMNRKRKSVNKEIKCQGHRFFFHQLFCFFYFEMIWEKKILNNLSLFKNKGGKKMFDTWTERVMNDQPGNITLTGEI